MTVRTTQIRLPYTDEQLFDLVADVEKFPEFLPWVIAARVIRRKGNTIWAEMSMGTNLLQKQFVTVASLHRPNRIEITCDDSMFARFEQLWKFESAADGGTKVEYQVEFRFQSNLLQMLIGGSFGERTAAMVRAFKRRAEQLYGARSAAGKVA